MDTGRGFGERLVVDGFWGAVPLYVIKDHRLRAGHLRVLAAILSCPSPHFPSRHQIGVRCGHTPRYCGKMICEMVAMGVLKRVRVEARQDIMVSTTVVSKVSTTVVPHNRTLKEFYLLTIMRETNVILDHT